MVILAVSSEARAQPSCPATTALLQTIADKVVQTGALQTGGAADYLLSTATERACKEADARPWLPATCTGLLGPQALLALRQRLILDIAGLPRRFVPGPVRRNASDAERGLRMAVALLDALLAGPDLSTLGGALWKASALSLDGAPASCAALLGAVQEEAPLRHRARRQGPAGDARWLAAPPPPGPPDSTTLESLLVAARLIQRLAREPPSLPKVDDEYVKLIARELVEVGIEKTDELAPGRREQALRLIQAARRLQGLQVRLREAATPEQYIEAARAIADVLVPSVALASVRSIELPKRLPLMIEHLVNGQLSSLLTEAMAMGAEASGVTLPPAVVGAAKLGVSLAMARDEEELRRELEAVVLPWTKTWMLDLNGSIPRLKSVDGGTELGLFGDISLGYRGKGWGVSGRAMYNLYNNEANFIQQRNDRALGDLEGWADWKVAERLHVEARLSGGVTYYGTSYDNLVRSTFQLARESSTVGRATALGALRWVPSSSIALGAWLGLGGQYESYWTSNTKSIADRGSTSQQSLGLTVESRLRARWRFVPGILALRARADLLRFSLSRDSQIFKVGQTIVNESTTTRVSQVDLNTRVFLDLDALGFLGFLPSAHVGLDVFSQTAEGKTITSTVPVIGAGLWRDAF